MIGEFSSGPDSILWMATAGRFSKKKRNTRLKIQVALGKRVKDASKEFCSRRCSVNGFTEAHLKRRRAVKITFSATGCVFFLFNQIRSTAIDHVKS